jgi:hypothetical protein
MLHVRLKQASSQRAAIIPTTGFDTSMNAKIERTVVIVVKAHAHVHHSIQLRSVPI